MDPYQILVIILSVMLGILLLISGIFIILLIKILKQVRRITDKADHVMEGIESVGDFFQKTAAPLALGKYVSGFFKAVRTRKRNNTRKG